MKHLNFLGRVVATGDQAKAIKDAMGLDGELMVSFNDDDLYVYDPVTLEYIQNLGKSRFHDPVVAENHDWARGMTAKYLGLWRVPA